MLSRSVLNLGTALGLLAALGAGCATGNSQTPSSRSGVHITQLPDRLRVDIDGALFTQYFFKDVARPYCYPVIGPGGAPLTRNWPMQDAPNESHDHPHHRSLWFAIGGINGQDFWSEQKNFGKTVHQAFTEIRSGRRVGIIKEHNNWVAADGKVVCTDNRTLRIYEPKDSAERVMDFEVTLHASQGPLTFNDTKEGMMAMRLAPTLRLKGKVGQGHIVTSAGVRDGGTWGTRADWCDYYGPVAGKTVGIAIFDNPHNPRHPTWWHVRDYGLFAANPFGEHDFEHLPNKHAGDLVLPAGQSLTFRYRFYFHEGDTQQAKVAEHYQQYAQGN